MVLPALHYRIVKTVKIIVCLLFTVLAGGAFAEGVPEESQAQPVAEEQAKKVTAVYGVTADDYLPASEHTPRVYIPPKIRKSTAPPVFDLPDAFYFIGGLIFLLILLSMLVNFINSFEEDRKSGKDKVANEHFNPE